MTHRPAAATAAPTTAAVQAAFVRRRALRLGVMTSLLVTLALARGSLGQCALAERLEHRRLVATDAGIRGGYPYDFNFASALASLGDLDGDGVGDLVAGAPVPGPLGSVSLLFLSPDGNVKAHSVVTVGSLPTTDPTSSAYFFGYSVAALGDLDGDGVVDLAVGDFGDSELGERRGAVWILFLREDGSVRSARKLNDAHGGFGGTLGDHSLFGRAVTRVGDLDGDGVPELAVGATGDTDGGGFSRGAVWILFLRADGSVHRTQKISDIAGGFQSPLHDGNRFGWSLASPGDLDGDGLPDLAVGSPFDEVVGENPGAVWILNLEADGTVKRDIAIRSGSDTAGGAFDDVRALGRSLAAGRDRAGAGTSDLLVGAVRLSNSAPVSGLGGISFLQLGPDSHVESHHVVGHNAGGLVLTLTSPGLDLDGNSVTLIDDVDGDGVPELAVGRASYSFIFNPLSAGYLWLVFLNEETVQAPPKVSSLEAGFVGPLANHDAFGSSVAVLGGEAGGGGERAVVVGTPGDDGGGQDSGAVWWLSLGEDGMVAESNRIPGTHSASDRFGAAVASLGDLDRDGFDDIAVGAPGVDNGGQQNVGAVWVVFLGPGGSIKSRTRIGSGSGGFLGDLDSGDGFGWALAAVGDLDGDGLTELAVGAPRDDDGDFNVGAVWILFLEGDGSVRSQVKISATQGDFGGALAAQDGFGSSLAALGLLDRNRMLAVGAPGDDGSDTDQGAVWLLSLRADGTVGSERRIRSGESGFETSLWAGAQFGNAVGALGDLDGDGIVDLGVGGLGGLWALMLRPDGTVRAHQWVLADMYVPLDFYDGFGSSLAWLGDLDGDGSGEFLVGAPGDDDGGANRGALWRLCLNPGEWQDLGGGLAGSVGVPRLLGQGTLAPGAPLTLTLDGALRHASATLVVGLAELHAPLLGGVLVPSPEVVLPGLLVDADGRLVLRTRWPTTLPAATRVWAQWWVLDPAGPQGWAATNAVVGTAP